MTESGDADTESPGNESQPYCPGKERRGLEGDAKDPRRCTRKAEGRSDILNINDARLQVPTSFHSKLEM